MIGVNRAVPNHGAKARSRARFVPAVVVVGIAILTYINWMWHEQIDGAIGARPWLGASLVLAGGCLWVWLIRIDLKNLRKRRLDARRRAGLCTACSYNLTGNTSGVCPECGSPAPAMPTPSPAGPPG